jgi:pullulanase/glycogen debranching enzyme
MLSENVRDLGLQSVLDFPMNDAVSTFATGDGADTTKLSYIFNWDDYYNSGSKVGAEISNSYSLVTFAGNHDEGRIGTKIWGYRSNISSSALAQRINFAYGMLFTMRGAPVLYYGDEVGMLGDGGDKAARQDMFPTDVLDWRSEARAGSSPIGTGDSLAITSHPIMNYIKSLGALRQAHPALTDGAMIWRKVTTKLPKEHGTSCSKQWKVLITKTTKWALTCTKVKSKLVWTVDYQKEVAGWSRIDAATNREYVVVANSTDGARTVTLPTSSARKSFTGVFGSAASATANATGQLTVTVAARSVAVFKANASIPAPAAAVASTVIYNKLGSPGAPVISAKLSTTTDPLTVTFIYRANSNSPWAVIGSDDSPSYKMAIPDWAWNGGSTMQVAAITKTTNGRLSSSPKLTVTK